MVKTRSGVNGASVAPAAAYDKPTPTSPSDNGSSLGDASMIPPWASEPRSTPNAPANRPKVLCLGMSYPSMDKQLKSYGVNPEEWLQGRSNITVDDVLKCVKDGMLTEMDARDLTRCVATEVATNAEVYTVSQEKAALYDTERHLFANFNRHSFVHQLHVAFGKDQDGNRQLQKEENTRRRFYNADYNIRYRQIVLDYFWIPQGWDDNHWSRSFFDDILPDLARQGMLDCDTQNYNLPCGVYLPFCLHCFRQIINALPLIRQFYAISFLRKEDLHEISVWKGTQTIDPYQMRQRLGKDLGQEDIYCTFGYQEVMEAGTSARDEPKETLVDILSRLEDFDRIRMIKLRPLRQHNPARSVPKKEHENGGLKGLVNPKLVKHGFMATVDKGVSNAKKCLESNVSINATQKKPPSTPPTRRSARSTRPDSTATTSKRKRAPSAITPAKKKKTTTRSVPNTDSQTSAKRALFRGSTLGMPTRSRAKALATPPPAPLFENKSPALPRRSSRRHVTFVSLPAQATRKRRQASSSASPARNASSTKPRSTPKDPKNVTNLLSSKKTGNEAEVTVAQYKTVTRVHDKGGGLKRPDRGAEGTSTHALNTKETQKPNTIEASKSSSVRLEQQERAAFKAAELALDDLLQTETTSPSARKTTEGSEHNCLTIATAPMDSKLVASPSMGRRQAESQAITVPAVTPSPSASLSKRKAKNKSGATTKQSACRALTIRNPSRVAAKQVEPSRRVTRRQAREAKLAASGLQPVGEREQEPMLQLGTSFSALSLVTDHRVDIRQNFDLTPSQIGYAETAKESVLVTTTQQAPCHQESVLVTTTQPPPFEVSDGTSSIDESDESVAKIDDESKTSVSVLVVSDEDIGEDVDLLQPAIVEPDFETGSLEPGLTTKERLQWMENKLDASARSFPEEIKREGKCAISAASPSPLLMTQKAKMSFKVESEVTRRPSDEQKKQAAPATEKKQCSKLPVRKNEGPLHRRRGSTRVVSVLVQPSKRC